VTRRHFFSKCALVSGSIALAVVARLTATVLRGAVARCQSDGAEGSLTVAPRAKNIIYLFMAGGPSQFELFDYKPKLIELNGQPIPAILHRRKAIRIHGSSHGTKLLGTRREFKQHGQSGMWFRISSTHRDDRR
jgi:hypothetical protein